jgi:hypothetical protein
MRESAADRRSTAPTGPTAPSDAGLASRKLLITCLINAPECAKPGTPALRRSLRAKWYSARLTALTLSCAAKAHVPKPQRRDGCRQNCSTHQAAWQPACPPRASKMREAARPPGRSQAATASASSSAAAIVLDHRSAGRTAPARFRNWCGAGERHRRIALGATSVELRVACGGGGFIAARPLSTRVHLNIY